MVMDYSRFGTRISLSDRFSQIRALAVLQSNSVNQSIGFGSGSPMKNFSETFSRSDRPLAQLQAGSERNRRLVLQMSEQESLLAEIYQRQANNASLAARRAKAAPKVDKPKVPISQRLGFHANKSNNQPKTKGSVHSRLGKKPVHQRLGVRPMPNQFKVQRPKRNKTHSLFNAGGPKPNNKVFLNGKPRRKIGGGGGNGGSGGGVRRQLTSEQLDNDLERYMNNLNH